MEDFRRYNHLVLCKKKATDELADLYQKFGSVIGNLEIYTEMKEFVCAVVMMYEGKKHEIESLQDKSISWPLELRTYFELGNIFVLHDRPSLENQLQLKLSQVMLAMETFQDSLDSVEISLRDTNFMLELVIEKSSKQREIVRNLDEDLNDLHEIRMMKKNKKRRG